MSRHASRRACGCCGNGLLLAGGPVLLQSLDRFVCGHAATNSAGESHRQRIGTKIEDGLWPRDDYSAYEDWATGSWHQYMVHYSSGEVRDHFGVKKIG